MTKPNALETGRRLGTVILVGLGTYNMDVPPVRAFVSELFANGNNGTFKMGGQDIDKIPNNHPFQNCVVNGEWWNYDPGQQNTVIEFDGQAPTKDGVLKKEAFPFTGGKGFNTGKSFDLSPSLQNTNPDNQGYWHVKVNVDTTSSVGESQNKSKVFKVTGCRPAPTATPTETKKPTNTPKPTASETPKPTKTKDPTTTPTPSRTSSLTPTRPHDSDTPTPTSPSQESSPTPTSPSTETSTRVQASRTPAQIPAQPTGIPPTAEEPLPEQLISGSDLIKYGPFLILPAAAALAWFSQKRRS